jgi:hypothetical protein
LKVIQETEGYLSNEEEEAKEKELNEDEEIEEEEEEHKEDVEMQFNLTRLIGDQKFIEKLIRLHHKLIEHFPRIFHHSKEKKGL